MDYTEIRKDFPLLENEKIVYLDNGATSQKPSCVLDAVDNFYKDANANPHRGSYGLSIEATSRYDEARKRVADFINAPKSSEIVFTKNATEALNLIAYSYGMSVLEKGDEVVLSIMEHHSNLVPWQEITKKIGATLSFMYINDEYEISEDEIKNKISDKTKIVGITHVSNVTGTINDVKKIAEYAHSKGAIVVVDASQSIPHMKVDVQELSADFLVFSGHKVLSPLGVGVLYGKQELLEKMPPFLMGGDMIEYVYEQDTTYAEVPYKFEAGTQNVAGAIGLAAAIDYMNKVGYEKIAEIEDELMCYAIEELSKLDYLTLYIAPNKKHHSSVISFNINGVHPHDVASILDNDGVCIRSGNHCAQPLLRTLEVDSTCRISISFYNTKAEIDKLVESIKKAYDMFKKYIR